MLRSKYNKNNNLLLVSELTNAAHMLRSIFLFSRPCRPWLAAYRPMPVGIGAGLAI